MEILMGICFVLFVFSIVGGWLIYLFVYIKEKGKSDRIKRESLICIKDQLISYDKEIGALWGDDPMTQELFETCLRTAVHAEDIKTYHEISRLYPSLATVYNDKISKELKICECELRTSNRRDLKLLQDRQQKRLSLRFGNEIAIFFLNGLYSSLDMDS